MKLHQSLIWYSWEHIAYSFLWKLLICIPFVHWFARSERIPFYKWCRSAEISFRYFLSRSRATPDWDRRERMRERERERERKKEKVEKWWLHFDCSNNFYGISCSLFLSRLSFPNERDAYFSIGRERKRDEETTLVFPPRKNAFSSFLSKEWRETFSLTSVIYFFAELFNGPAGKKKRWRAFSFLPWWHRWKKNWPPCTTKITFSESLKSRN